MTEAGKVNILLVDDQPSKLLSYEAILKELGENLIMAGSAREALQHLLRVDVAVILVDVCMPELDGFELASMLREHPRFEKTAIIFVSAIHLTEFDRVRGYETGAVDYIPVPVVPELLRAKVRVFVELYRKTRELVALNKDLEQRVAERTAELEASNVRLRESEERLRLASEAAGFGTYDYNVEANRVHCSTGLKALLATSVEEDMSVDELISLVHPLDRDEVSRCLAGARNPAADRHEIEFRVALADGSVRWLLNRGRTFVSEHFTGTRAPVRVMGTMLDITERRRSEERQILLMGELDHRVKNILANMRAMAQLSSVNASSVASFVSDLDGRIGAISRAHTLLRAKNWNGADLLELVDETLAPFREAGNIEVDGCGLTLDPGTAQTFALMLHELATNAVKYGALSSPGGKVSIAWSGAPPLERLRFVWREVGGPAVKAPSTSGFGLRVLRKAASAVGRTDCGFDEAGFVFSLFGHECEADVVEPLAQVPIRDTPHPSRLHILVVEDEPLVALQMQSDLEDDGHLVVGPAATVGEGLELASTQSLDCAILDVRLGSVTSEPIADRLIERKIPFALATGYTDSVSLPPHLRGRPRIVKPYEIDLLRGVLEQLRAGPGMSRAGIAHRG